MQSAAEPLIRSLTAYYITATPELFEKEEKSLSGWQYLNSWMPDMFKNEKLDININLTPYIPVPGQYEIKLRPGNNSTAQVSEATLWYDGEKALDEFVKVNDSMVLINRTAQITNETSIMLKLSISSTDSSKGSGSISFRKIP